MIPLLEKNNGYLSSSEVYRSGLADEAKEMLRSGDLLLGRSVSDGTYYYGLPNLKVNKDIDIRWIKKPRFTVKDMPTEEYDRYKAQGKR